MKKPVLVAAFMAVLLFSPAVRADQPELVASSALSDMGLEELMSIPVISVSKREENFSKAASAVHIITASDIIRSGATNIPEALRLVPGLHVARKDANHYVVTSRGFNDLPFSDKLLVMVDGRTVHSPTFSQVWWPALQYPLQDIERIEVILGPGSALWGANAINGIINIITRESYSTQDGYLETGGGNELLRFATLRKGWTTDEGTAMRAYVMGSHTDNARAVKGEWSSNPRDGGPMFNEAHSYQTGVRADWAENSTDYRISVDYFRNDVGSEGSVFQAINAPTQHYVHRDVYTGGNLLVTTKKQHSDELSTRLRFYYDYSGVERVYFHEQLHTMDLELQSDRQWSVDSTLSMGLTGRYVQSRFKDTAAMTMPDTKTASYGIFAQNETFFADQRVKFVAGAKAEKNEYTKWEFQPNARLAWLGDHWTGWVSASHAVRLTNLSNNELKWNYKSEGLNSLPAVGVITGSSQAKPEEVYAYEAGIRAHPSNSLAVSLSVYHNEYSNIMDIYDSDNAKQNNSTLQPGNYYTWPIYFQNVYKGSTEGAELSVDARPREDVRIFFALATSWVNVEPKAGYSDYTDPADWINNATPQTSAKVRFSFDITENLETDLNLYSVGMADGVGGQAYERFDARIGYSPSADLTLELVGRNLTSYRHKEYESQYMEEIAWIERDAYFRLTYRF